MAYTIVKTNGTVLTTIPDGTINTTSTSLGLPGKNFAGWGQPYDTNFVHLTENFANASPPPNPLQGQLWYDTSNNVLFVCPADGTTNANGWLSLTATAVGGTTTFDAIDVTGNVQANNITVLNNITSDSIVVRVATVTANANIANAFINTANIGNLFTRYISTGSNVTTGLMQGTWTLTGGYAGNSLVVANGNVYASGIKTDNYYYSNGIPFNPSGSYGDANVLDYLTGANGVTQFDGNIAPSRVTTTAIYANTDTYANVTPGIIRGTYTIVGGLNGNSLIVSNGNVYATGFKSDHYYYANGDAWAPYSNTTASSFLPTYTGVVGNVGGEATFRGSNITSGSNTTPGSMVGAWTINGASSGNALIITGGNLTFNTTGNTSWGIKSDKFYYSNGVPISFAGTYSNANVASYLTVYSGNVGAGSATFYGSALTTGANVNAGTITGNWTLSAGSKLQATYADLAERFEADAPYDPGTVVELGGEKEITAVQYELSEDVFGVVSDTAAYLMNSGAGSDETHPPIAVGGRVLVKVIGKVKKGQRLVSAGGGIARGAKQGEATAFNIIGRSLENKPTDEVGAVEAFVKIN